MYLYNYKWTIDHKETETSFNKSCINYTTIIPMYTVENKKSKVALWYTRINGAAAFLHLCQVTLDN